MELKKSNISSREMVNAKSYKTEGFYLNIDENDIKQLVVVSKKVDTVFYIGINDQLEYLFETNITKTEPIEEESLIEIRESNTVSENFALKMLSIATMNDKYKEL